MAGAESVKLKWNLVFILFAFRLQRPTWPEKTVSYYVSFMFLPSNTDSCMNCTRLNVPVSPSIVVSSLWVLPILWLKALRAPSGMVSSSCVFAVALATAVGLPPS